MNRWLLKARIPCGNDKFDTQEYLVDGSKPEVAIATLSAHLSAKDLLGTSPLDLLSMKCVDVISLVEKDK